MSSEGGDSKRTTTYSKSYDLEKGLPNVILTRIFEVLVGIVGLGSVTQDNVLAIFL